jgi:hypothetical protein
MRPPTPEPSLEILGISKKHKKNNNIHIIAYYKTYVKCFRQKREQRG